MEGSGEFSDVVNGPCTMGFGGDRETFPCTLS